MKKWMLILIIIALSLIIAGITVAFVGFAIAGFEINELNMSKHTTNTYEPDGEFDSVYIETATCDIVLLPSSDGKCSVVCTELAKVPHTVSIDNGTLTVKYDDQRKWFDHIGIFWGKTAITVYLPESEYSSLTLCSATGDLEIPKDFKFGKADLSTSTGDVKMLANVCGSLEVSSDTGDIQIGGNASALTVKVHTGDIDVYSVKCKSFSANTTTGDMSLRNLIVETGIEIRTDTGDVEFDRCDAAYLKIQTDTGDVEGSLLSDKVFATQTDTGKVRVPNSSEGGKCEITTDTGDIEISIVK